MFVYGDSCMALMDEVSSSRKIQHLGYAHQRKAQLRIAADLLLRDRVTERIPESMILFLERERGCCVSRAG